MELEVRPRQGEGREWVGCSAKLPRAQLDAKSGKPAYINKLLGLKGPTDGVKSAEGAGRGEGAKTPIHV